MSSGLELNPEQRAAVEHGEGPLLIIAGPGSGKTRAITERIVHLLGGRGDGKPSPYDTEGKPSPRSPEGILALTFTNKAAWEMQSRVQEALPHLEPAPLITTYHAFCLQALAERQFDRQLLDPIDLWIFLRRRMRSLDLEHYRKLAEPGAFLHDLNEFFSRCQDELVEPGDFTAYVAGLRQRLGPEVADPLDRAEMEKREELARVFCRSRDLLDEAGCTSFGSLISETLRLWDREPDLVARYRERFRYVLVDEFQDSNYAQVELLRRLVARPYNITAVGDDDQAIYRFRGASHGAFGMFDRAFPGHRTVYLNRNYRSGARILRASQVVITKNEGRYPSKPALETANPEGARVLLLESPDAQSEAAWVADEVERLAKRGVRLADIAILYRSHLHREGVVREFRRREIPFDICGLSILKTAMVRDLVAYLHLIQSPHHNISLTRVLLAPRWRFPEALAKDARRGANRNRSSLYTAIRAMQQTLFARDLNETGWAELQDLLDGLRKAAKLAPVTALFDRLTKALGLDALSDDRESGYVKAFRNFLVQWEEKSLTGNLAPPGAPSDPQRPIDEFMEYFPLFLEAGGQIEAPEPRGGVNAVQMMTVHAAKGLEFPIVFVLSIARQRFPTSEKKPVIEFPDALRKGPPAPAGIHLQEERRLFYVALTRARERLYLSSFVKQGRKLPVFAADLLSDPAVEAQDIERIQVPAVDDSAGVSSRRMQEVAAGASGIPQRVRLSGRVTEENGQGRLFPSEDDAVFLHPDLETWARTSQGIAGEPGSPPPLSATGIETYQNCPLRFKFRHLLKIQTEPQAVLTFGAVMHQSVRHYFKLREEGLPRFADLERFYLGAWKDVGFQDDFHAAQMKQAGIEQLREFVALHNALPSAGQVASEQSFSFEVQGIKVQGRIDQVQSVQPQLTEPAAPVGREVELIDYKTGRPKSQKDADSSLQLSVYALAARQALGLNPSRLTFYNLTNNQAVSTIRTEDDLDGVMREIRDVARAIRDERFEPTPGYACRRCEYAPLCPAQEER